MLQQVGVTAAHDVVGDARPQPRRGDDDGEEHHGREECPG